MYVVVITSMYNMCCRVEFILALAYITLDKDVKDKADEKDYERCQRLIPKAKDALPKLKTLLRKLKTSKDGFLKDKDVKDTSL